MAATRAAFIQFPEEILTKVFSLLNMEDLLQAAAVCKAWQHGASSETLWELICRRRWRLWTKQSDDAASSSHRWRERCLERVKLDRSAQHLVTNMAWPLKRHKCLRKLVSLGDFVVEELERLSTKQGDEEEGTRYFALMSLERVNQNNCITAMRELLAAPLPQLEDSLARGALIIAKLRYRDLDIHLVESKLDDWKEILLRRLKMDADIARYGGLGTPAGALAGLKHLNALLFGDARDPLPDEDVDPGVFNDPLADRSDWQCMNLRANREDYYNPSNLYLNEVLDSRKGVEISLAIIHSAMGRRCGIPVQMVAIPMHFVTKVGAEGEADERFVNVFDSGRLLQRNECVDLIQSMGLHAEPSMLAPVPPSKIFVAICDNLIAIHSQGDGEQDGRRQSRERQRMLLPLLDLLLAITPEDCSNRFTRVKVLLENSDFEGALDDLEALLQLTEKAGSNAQGIPRALLQQYLQNAQERRAAHAAWCSRQKSPRPPDVRFRVGNIVRQVRFQYPGVIFGWDKEFSLDEEWITLMKIDQLQYGRNQPFYRVLVDQNFRSTSTYVAQENIELAPDGGPILHEDLGMHFLGYRNGNYIPNDYLRYLYSDDIISQPGEPQRPMPPEAEVEVPGVESMSTIGELSEVRRTAVVQALARSTDIFDPMPTLPEEHNEEASNSKPSE